MNERLYSPGGGLVPNFNGLNPSPTAPNLIGLSGYARSGKDTVAGCIASLYGHTPVSFAMKLKALAYDINPYVAFPTTDKVRLREVVDNIGWEEAKAIEEVRRILQEVGTRCRQHLGTDIWVDAAFTSLTDGKRVFTDVRFKNEAQAIRDEGGMVLRVVRPGIKAVNSHISEVDLDDWNFDAHIVNDGDITDLEGEIQRVLGEFR